MTPIEARVTDDPAWQLGQLAAAYQAEVTRRRAHYPEVSAGVCRYCGVAWRQWHGSKVDGHAACVVSRAFMEQVAAFADEHFTISLSSIAQRLSVGDGIVRAWWNIVKGNPRR